MSDDSLSTARSHIEDALDALDALDTQSKATTVAVALLTAARICVNVRLTNEEKP